MSFLINPYWFVASSAGIGAWVYKSGDLTGQDFTTPTLMTFDSEVSDDSSWHSVGSDTSRFTIPSGVNYVRVTGQVLTANLTLNSTTRLQIIKGGSALSPAVIIEDTTAGTAGLQITSYPIPVTAGNYLEFTWFVSGDTSSDIIASGTWFAIERLG